MTSSRPTEPALARKGINGHCVQKVLRSATVLGILLLLPALSGCGDFVNQFNRPGYHVQDTQPKEHELTRDNTFRVTVEPPQPIHIEASSSDGRMATQDGDAVVTCLVDQVSIACTDVTITLKDGTWDISYRVNGYKWASYSGVTIDATPPQIGGLQLIGEADKAHRHYQLGAGATVNGDTSLRVVELPAGTLLATSLPVDLNDLTDGLHAYLISARDDAGNYANATVQVRVGSAVDLPAGKYTFGVVARYSNTLTLWDVTDLGAYDTVTAATSATDHSNLGSGYGITPTDAAVQQVVAQVVTSDMTTAQRAQALLKYMMQNLHYDTSRLDNDFLLTPHQVLLDTEDKAGRDCIDATGKAADCDGLVMDGAGNGVRGGICRDLAATYVSLLRAAGVPARLVTGYVAGTVNGFHAWAEFYGGTPAAHPSQSPWIPVDVSSVDGTYKDAVFLQSFGIQLPEYLTLRAVPPASEVRGWSTVLGVHYVLPNRSSEPDINFQKNVTSSFTTSGVLCFDPATHARAVADSSSACGSLRFSFDHFTTATTRIIDYGVLVAKAPSGTQVQAEVGYPFPESVAPNKVDFVFYGKPFTLDVAAGKADSSFTV